MPLRTSSILVKAAIMPKSPPLSELSLIEQIRRSALRRRPTVPLGIGDDCAILRPPASHEILVTTDFTLEGRHFRRDTHPPESVGHRSIARGISDIAAMGGTPLAAFLSLALPADLLASPAGQTWITRFFQGLHSLADQHGITLAGGDTAESPSTHILADIILTGSAPAGKALRRSTARPGDLLYVTGHLGGAAAELQSLFSATARTRKPPIPGPSHPHLFPIPRLKVGKLLVQRDLASACIDLSDGLSTDLAHLCQASNLHATINQSALPIHPLAAKLPAPEALHHALHGGEDYELLFSAPPSKKIPHSLAGIPITQIGHLTRLTRHSPQITLLTLESNPQALTPGGWEHFRASERRSTRESP